MKKLLLVCCIVLGVSTLSKAQGGGGGGGQRGARTPEAQTAQLKTTLALTADQETKVLAIYAAQKVRTDSLTAANPITGGDMQAMQAMMAKRTPITNATNAKIKAVLTADQAATFQKGLDAQAERMKQFMNGGGMGGGGGTPPPPRG